MNSIKLHIANASGSLDAHLNVIKNAFKDASVSADRFLRADKIDILIIDAPYNTIPELGVGGYTPSSNVVYINIDSSKEILEKDLYMGMLHEIHHAIRWRDPGYGTTLKEALLTEGLATLFEEECSGETPIYATVKITKDQILKASKELNNKKYNHIEWFITGNKDIPRWFGYTYGYQLAKSASNTLKKPASELVSVSASDVLK